MMLRDSVYTQLSDIALTEFPDIVERTHRVEGKLRLLLTDGSFLDVWFSEKRKGTYAYHWERREIDETVYRHNNIPDKEARKLKTFPKHFHEKSQTILRESHISDTPEEALRSFLVFARTVMSQQS
jgi:hypothetical protein